MVYRVPTFRAGCVLFCVCVSGSTSHCHLFIVAPPGHTPNTVQPSPSWHIRLNLRRLYYLLHLFLCRCVGYWYILSLSDAPKKRIRMNKWEFCVEHWMDPRSTVPPSPLWVKCVCRKHSFSWIPIKWSASTFRAEFGEQCARASGDDIDEGLVCLMRINLHVAGSILPPSNRHWK